MNRAVAEQTLVDWLGKKNGDQWTSHTYQDVFDMFKLKYPDAQSYGAGKTQLLYREGTRANKVLLVAHADGYWESGKNRDISPNAKQPTFSISGNLIMHTEPSSRNGGIGADDRAGCAMIDLLSNTGHSLLITNWEEQSKYGSLAAVQGKNKDGNNYGEKDKHKLVHSFKKHQFILALDRQTEKDVKPYVVYYDRPKHCTINGDFKEYLSKKQLRVEKSPNRSDAFRLSQLTGLCAVNMSIGCREQHYDNEKLDIDAWYESLVKAEEWLSQNDIPKFETKL